VDDVQKRNLIEDALDTDPRRPGFQSGYTDEDIERAYDRGHRDGDARAKLRWFIGFLAGAACMFVLLMVISALTGL
jgi:hypothetical protein